MSITTIAARFKLSGPVIQLIATCLDIYYPEEYMPLIRVEAVGSGILILNVPRDLVQTVDELRRDIADIIDKSGELVHYTMIGLTEGHGGPIINTTNQILIDQYPDTMIFVMYYKTAKCTYCSNNCSRYNRYNNPICSECFEILSECNRQYKDYRDRRISNQHCSQDC